VTLLPLYLFAADSGDRTSTPRHRSPHEAAVALQRAADARALRAEHDQNQVAAIRTGDVAVFEQLFLEHYPSLVAFAAAYLRDGAVAEEVVADVFAALWDRRTDWVVRTTIEAYLYAIVRNRVIDVLRVQRRREELDTEYASGYDALTTVPLRPDEALETDERDTILNQRIQRAIDALPQRYRDVIILRCQREMGYDEVAEVLGVSTGAVQQQMSRAIRMLRAALGPDPKI